MSEEEYLEKLINDHWEYIGALLRVHGEGEAYDKIKFHYTEAFRHGWKHAMEYRKTRNEWPE